MKHFRPADYGPVFGPLVETAPLNALGPGHAVTEMRETLAAVSLPNAFAPHTIADRAMAQACFAGLWLRYDFLDQSHAISQEIHNPAGSFWHGILHRREPDYDNAKYWFRRVGRHPVFVSLLAAANEIADAASESTADFLRRKDEWDPFAFVDLVESVASKPSSIEKLCRQIQLREWELLFDFCYRAAVRTSTPGSA